MFDTALYCFYHSIFFAVNNYSFKANKKLNSNGNLLCKDLKQHWLSSGLKKNTSAGIDCPVMNEKKLGEFSKGGKETESLLGNVLQIKKSLQISRRKKKSESQFKNFETQILLTM